ncbi:MAG: CDP-diacylglycerol--glycerol-3-phosphate 3-phosphatidyltransferase [Elusimicrobia bacterium]|nr:CDP-diacylglycerol--glycerol-3-phosphate 3-phosphatidyltransferase [Elusimicrobiota bacterium]
MNLPNKLTVARLASVPFFLLCVSWDNVYARLGALLIFVGAGITDLVDGHIARTRNMVTPLGVFLDPLADKLIITAAFISFIELRDLHIPAWMIVAIVGREFVLTGLRAVAASQGQIMGADDGGKFKTSIQNTAIIAILVALLVASGLERFGGHSIESLYARGGWRGDAARVLDWVPFWMAFGATLFSLVTGVSYLRKHWALLKENP